jgi:hypothetical protein
MIGTCITDPAIRMTGDNPAVSMQLAFKMIFSLVEYLCARSANVSPGRTRYSTNPCFGGQARFGVKVGVSVDLKPGVTFLYCGMSLARASCGTAVTV